VDGGSYDPGDVGVVPGERAEVRVDVIAGFSLHAISSAKLLVMPQDDGTHTLSMMSCGNRVLCHYMPSHTRRRCGCRTGCRVHTLRRSPVLLLHLLVGPSFVVRARQLLLDACRRAAVRVGVGESHRACTRERVRRVYSMVVLLSSAASPSSRLCRVNKSRAWRL
jgi:hypothetical protein